MKKLVKMLAVVTFISSLSSGCVLFNTLGLNPGHMKGTEAADQIIDASIVTDLIQYTMFFGRPNISIFSLIADDLAGIEPDAYYKKSDVDACVNDIKTVGLVLTSFLTNIISCDIKKDNAIYGPP